MPRPPHPWRDAKRGWWYVTISGKRTRLPVRGDGPGAAEQATAAWRQLLRAAKQLELVPPAGDGRTVRQAAGEFLAAKVPRLSPGCAANYRAAVRDFLAGLGAAAELPVGAITAEMVEATAERPRWGDSTRHGYLGTLAGFFKWAGHPLPIRRPPMGSRGADSVISDEQFLMVLGAVGGDFRDYLRVLRETGARPGEAATLTAEMVDWDNALARVKKHKTRKATGKDRVIHFNPAAMQVLRRQRERYGSGLLFRSDKSNTHFRKMMIVARLGTVGKKLGFRVCAYGLGRHSFATKALERGVPDAVVAALLGHKGTSMVHSHYAHLGHDSRVMKAALEKMSGPGPGTAAGFRTPD